MPVESIVQNKGGVIMYNPDSNKIMKQYVHDKKWKRVGWRGGKIYGNHLIATDWNELHYFNIKKWKYDRSFQKNTFNDLHYVEIHNDKLYIVNTGLDAIETFNNPLNPEFEKIEFLFDVNPKLFKKRDIPLDNPYNKMMKFKPHSAHPNCITFDKNRILVTCFGKNQKFNSGEIIDLNTGKRLFKRCFDCHDGIFYKDNFYATWTRHATILEYKNLKNNSLPMQPTNKIKIGSGRGWWRGMVIADNKIYVFASDGYKKKETTIRMATIDLKTMEKKSVKLPVIDGVHWDTVYQPNIWAM
jgi:hypothetical protein